MITNRKALVIGNSKYQIKPLRNPANDASAIADILTDKGFSVTKKTDLHSVDFFTAIDDLCKDAPDIDTVLFYFAGHGVEYEEENYLIPCDFTCTDNLKYESPSLSDICKRMSEAYPDSNKIIIVDACRTNGAKNFLNMLTSRGGIEKCSIRTTLTRPRFSQIDTFIAFATAPGMVAADAGVLGENGLYTECLIESILIYGMSIEELFRLVREKVIAKSNFKQIPWEHSSLTTYFSFDNYDVPCKLIDTITLPFDELYSSAFSANTEEFILAGSGSKVLVQTFDSSHDIEIHLHDDVHGEVLLINDDYLLVGDSSGYLHVFAMKFKHKEKIHLFDSAIFAISFISDKTAVACGDSGVIKEIDLEYGKVLKTINTKIKHVYAATYVPGSSSYVVIAGGEYRLEVWDIKQGKIVKALNNNMYYTNTIAFSPDGKILATGHENGVINFWDANCFSLINSINLPERVENIVSVIEVVKDSGEIPTNHIVSLSFSPDSNVITVGTSEPSIEFIDVKYVQIIKKIRLDFPVSRVYSVCQSTDGNILISTGHKRKAYVFCTNRATDKDIFKHTAKALQYV